MRRALRRWLDRRELSESAVTLSTAIVVGTLTGFGAVAFARLLRFLQWAGYGAWEQVVDGVVTYPSWHLIVAPAAGGLVCGYLVFHYAREAKGHGVPEVMEAVALKGGRIRPHVALIKALASAFSIGTGGAAGREGPIVQIGSAMGSTVGQWLRLSDERTINLVACGAAGGIAATFNAPIAGAIFAMEIIIGRLHVLYFGAVVVSSVLADVIAHSFEGDTSLYSVPAYGLRDARELLLYALLALLAALAANGFTRALYAVEDFWDALRIPDTIKPMLGGVGLGLVGVMSFKLDGMPRVFGVGHETTSAAALGTLTLQVALVLLLLKAVATCLTLGSGGSGGVFAPSLFMGAMLGSGFGQLANQWFPGVTAPSGAYALVGMAAFFASAAHAPVTAILIVFEMTRDYGIILPLMLATVVSTVIARLLSSDSIYTLKLTRRGIRLEQGLDAEVLQGVRVAEVMNIDARPVSMRLPLPELNAVFRRVRGNTVPVVDAAGQLAGLVSSQDLDRAVARGSIEGVAVADIATTEDLLVAEPDEPIGEALRRLQVRGLTLLPVVDRNNPRRLVGTITREDIEQAYSRGVSRRARHVQRAAESGIEDGTDMNLIYVDIPGDAELSNCPVAELPLPREALIVSLEREGRRNVVHGDTCLRPGDRIAVVVTRENAAAIRDMLTGRGVPEDGGGPAPDAAAETPTPA